MKAAMMYEAGDVRVVDVPDPQIVQPTDAILRVTRASICGSDLWPYRSRERDEDGQSMGHEGIGVVESVGSEVTTVKPGDFALMPFAYSDGTCEFCHDGLNTACVHVGFFGSNGMNGAQAEALRIPFADGTLYSVDAPHDEALMSSLLTLTDVMGTGHHAAVSARVSPGQVALVVGDGAVGLCGVIAAKRLGADRIVIMGSHEQRLSLAKEFGATDVVTARGPEGVDQVLELTDGFGAHSVLECVGTETSTETAILAARPGGSVGRVGVPQGEVLPGSQPAFFKNLRIAGGPAPARAYIEELLPEVLEGKIDPGRVFDLTVDLDETPAGYVAMDQREAIKVVVKP
jgi:threonine dehydrogenase-like Zn-dependent dehydrogenase